MASMMKKRDIVAFKVYPRVLPVALNKLFDPKVYVQVPLVPHPCS